MNKFTNLLQVSFKILSTKENTFSYGNLSNISYFKSNEGPMPFKALFKFSLVSFKYF